MASTRKTGQFGGVFIVADASTSTTAEACNELTALPGDADTLPVKTYFQITAPGKRILDPDKPITVKDGAVTISPNLYTVHYGAGIVEFFAARTGTPAITVDGFYIPTTGAVGKAGECKDWEFTVTSQDVDGSVYGTGFGAHFAGMANGTFSFDKMQTDTAMYHKFRSAKRVVLCLYEDVRASEYWVVFGRILSFPNSAPIGGMVMGKISGTLLAFPDYRADAIG